MNGQEAYCDNYEMRVADWGFGADQDFSPPDFQVVRDPQPLKDRLRCLVYPGLIALDAPRLHYRYRELGIPADWQLVLGARGQSGRYLVSRVNRFESVHRKRVCLLGIGLGRELEHWAEYSPGPILGLDVLNYAHAWSVLRAGYPNLDLGFRQVPPDRFAGVADAGFDILSSENVFEHVRDLDAVLGECARVIRPGGLLFSSFGPLWFTWSGDHFAATREDGDGFAHLRSDFSAYKETLRALPFRSGDLADGRVWVLQDLFSFLRPLDYVRLCARHFEQLSVRAHLSMEALAWRERHPEDYASLCERHGLAVWEPLISGFQIAARRRAAPGEAVGW